MSDLPYDEPSDEFSRAVCDGGSPVHDCGFCGRTNFDLNGEFMDDGELERLLEKQKASPDKYFGQDNGISSGWIGGKAYVWGCPCNKARPYENFIWNNRHVIMTYLHAMTAKNLSDAKADAEAVRKAAV
jgi:hypothetical protein